MTQADVDLGLTDFVDFITSQHEYMIKAHAHRQGWRYQTFPDLLLDLAAPREAPLVLPDDIAWMEPGNCYENAHSLMLERDLTYVEGIALFTAVPIQHAWCETADGQIVDPTWVGLKQYVGGHLRPDNAFYLGVRFSTEYKIRHMFTRERYAIFGDDIGDHIQHGFTTNDDGFVVTRGEA